MNGPANTEAHRRELVDPEVIHHADVVIGIGVQGRSRYPAGEDWRP